MRRAIVEPPATCRVTRATPPLTSADWSPRSLLPVRWDGTAAARVWVVSVIAVALLAKAGFRTVASTGRREELEGYLRELGAAEVVGRG